MQRKLVISLLFGLGWTTAARGEAMLQLFNLTWNEIAAKMPEIAEAGYESLWLPPPAKANSQFSAGYDMFDPFDLGDKDQKGTIATRYGTKDELVRMVRIAHRFGLRVYFDNIMNHRSYDVPGYDAYTPITVYPGLLPEDFHLRVTPEGFYRKWDNISDWNNVWQIQNRNFSDLIDLAQENPNLNFGPFEGATNPKISFVRHPNNPEYYMDQQLSPIDPGTTFWRPFNGAQGDPVPEDTASYLIRAALWFMNETRADGLRLDAVKHVPAPFFGDFLAATPFGYTGAIQVMYDWVHGYGYNNPVSGYNEPDNNRNSCFDAEAIRNDALIFGEHLGEPPSFSEYTSRGMRLVDAPLHNTLNNILGNPGASLVGMDQRDFDGYGPLNAATRVMYAQSHDNGYANRRDLQLAYYFTREGIPVIYSDGWRQSATCRECGGEFPRNAYAPYLGEFGDNKMPEIVHLHGQLARGGSRSRWSDADVVAYERYEYREGVPNPFNNPDSTVLLFAMNDNYGFPGDISFDDGVAHTLDGYYGCFPVQNSRGVGLVVGFRPGSVLYNYAESANGSDRACKRLLVRVATNDRNYAEATKNHPDPVQRAVFVGSQPIPPGGGAIEFKIPSGGYVLYSYEAPRPSRAAMRDVITIEQGGREVPRMIVRRSTGPDGDQNYNPIFPFQRRGSVDIAGNVIGGQNVSNLTYAIDIPVITNAGPINIILRADASADNILVKLDGGVDLNSHMGLGPQNQLTGAMLDNRDNRPGYSHDMRLGYEQPAFQTRNGPEKFAAENVARNNVTSGGAETWHYTIGGGSATVNGVGNGAGINTATAQWVYHRPNDTVHGSSDTMRTPLNPAAGQPVNIWVKVGYAMQINRGFIYYTTDGTNPEGSFGLPKPGTTTQVVPLSFQFTAPAGGGDSGTADWWRGTIPAQSSGQVRYKVALYKGGQVPDNINPISDLDLAKYYGLTQFAITNFNPQTARIWLHNNLNTNDTRVGLEEGFHILRARAFLPRAGKSSIYTTYAQTFYYDAQPPQGVIAFPANNGDTLGSHQYGVVVRADITTTEVEYNITDNDPNNDDIVTGKNNGNGLSNGVPVFAKARQVFPFPGLNQQYPNFPLEYRFNYVAVPASGTATITVRLKEASTATFTNRVGILTRTVNCAAPPQRLDIAFPATDGETIFLDQNDFYQIVICFTDSLGTDLENFTIKIDGAVQPRYRPDGSPNYLLTGSYCGSGRRDLRFNWSGMSAGQHLIEVLYNGQGLALQASRLVNVVLTGIGVNIINPPAADDAGRSPFTIVLPDKTNATPEERQFTIITETSLSVTNVNISFNITTNVFSGGKAVLDTNFVGQALRWNFLWTNLFEGVFTIRADATGGGSNTAFRTTAVVLRQIVPANPNDDDDDDDGLTDYAETVVIPLPSTQPENWTQGEVHVAFFTGKTDPLNPDSDNDGLPDALELGLESSIATNTNLSADTNGDGFKNFIADADPPRFNTTDNSSLPGFNLNSARTDLIRGTVTDPNNPDTDYDNLMDSVEDANRNGRVDIALTNSAGVATSIIQFPPTIRTTARIDRAAVAVQYPNAVWLETDPNTADSDGDNLLDGTEDLNRNGYVDVALINCASLPCSGVITAQLAYAQIPHIGNNLTNQKSRAIHRTALWAQYPNAVLQETDPLLTDSDGDGLPDGWEVQYGLEPLDNGFVNFRTGATGNPDHGANGDPDNDSVNNLTEFLNNTDPRKPNNIPPLVANPIRIGPGPVIGTAGGVVWYEEFQDWTVDDLKALDEYDGAGFLRRQRDVYPWWDGYDWSRDIVAFYARDGGLDGNYYFRVDFHDLRANAEQGFLDVYIVIDTGNPNVGEIQLPDDIDTKTEMRWEVVVAAYESSFGRCYVKLPGSPLGQFQARGYNPTGNGFRGAYYRGDLDSVEIAIARQALLDAGWDGASPLQFQVFTTKDGTCNTGSARCPGDTPKPGSDITDTIYDDDIPESDNPPPPNDTLKYWFTSINHTPVNLSSYHGSLTVTNRPNTAKLAVFLHGHQAILPGSIIQNLISNHTVRTPPGTFAPLDPGNQPTGYYRALESAEVFGIPLNLHISGSLLSAMLWARTDPALDPTGSRDGVKFVQRIASLLNTGKVSLVTGMFADHIAPYFTGSVNRTGIQLQNEILRRTFGPTAVTADSPLYLAERVVDGKTLSDLAAHSGHNFLILDQMVHLWWWGEQLYGFGNGRQTALGDDGYRINRLNGMRAFFISGASDQMYFNTDFGLTHALRQVLIRKALSSGRDQLVILGDDWEKAGGIGGGNNNPDRLNLNFRWIANHPWIKPVRLDKFGTGLEDINNDGRIHGPSGDWPLVVERGTTNFNQQAKELIRHNTRLHYDNWWFGLPGAEESFFNKFPPLRASVFGSKRLGHVLTNGTVLADAWADVRATTGIASNLAALVYLHGIFETAYHDEDNNNIERFSTGDYKYPDTTGFDTLALFAAKPNSRQTRQAGIVARAAAWAASNPGPNPVAQSLDVDHDGEQEYILSNNRVWAVFERIGGRCIAAFARDPSSPNAVQVLGNLVSSPCYETEEEGDTNMSGNPLQPHAYRTSAFKDWFAVTNATGFGSTRYVNDLYTVASAPTGTGWRFTSSDGRITKTITLAADSTALHAAYQLSGPVSRLYVRHGLAPDLYHLVLDGQKNLSPLIVTNNQISLTHSNDFARTTATILLTGTGRSNTVYNANATDDGAGGNLSFRMRNQAQTHQVELESTATAFSFGISLVVDECGQDSDGDGLNNCQELALGTNPHHADTDGDGMNDGWEHLFRNPLVWNNPNADPDSDGQTDLAESVAGTNPDNPNDYFRITNIVRVGNTATVTWTSVPGKFYDAWATTNLSGAAYQKLNSAPLPAAGTLTSFGDTNASPNTKFYRIQVRP
ncbi:MAG: alpha-amylase family glycosyl hydrolase [Verrucomicrobiae bacterium]|nr:alpha-amylase family glycosyl hydrolase [Verrucomicrobiae bacterium]